MKRLFEAVILVAVLMNAGGCGQSKTLLNPIHLEVSRQQQMPGARMASSHGELRARVGIEPRRAVLLPFADYSPNASPSEHAECHYLLRAAFEEAFCELGVEMVGSKEEVSRFLCKEAVILDAAPILREESPRTSLMLREWKEDWSAEARAEIGRVLHENLLAMQSRTDGALTKPLDRLTIRAIGEAFGADYVIRGRITVYQTSFKWDEFSQPEETIVFYFTGPDARDLEVALATRQAYEYLNRETLLPAGITGGETQPFDRNNQKITPLLRIDLFVQDARSGELVYAEPVEVRSAQILSLSPQQGPERYELMDRALKEAAKGLIQPLL